MQVRTLHFSDFLKLGRMHQADIGLNLPYALVMPDLPLPASLTQHLPVNSLNSSVFICEDGGKPRAWGQVKARPRREEWEILSLGVVGNVQPETLEVPPVPPSLAEGSLETFDLNGTSDGAATRFEASTATAEAEQPAESLEEPSSNEETEPENFSFIHSWPVEIELAWLKVLEHMVVEAGEKGIVRVYARLLTDSPQLETFSQLGFHAYTHETLFYLQYNQPLERPAALSSQIKEQRSRDAWHIHQLYSTITPSFVQNSEQQNPRSWEIHKAYLPRPTKETGYVLIEDHKVVAYIRILSYRNKHLVRIMNVDNQRDLLPDLIRYALSTLKASSDTQVYCTVREYQVEQEAVLEDCGFVRAFGKQAVLVKHTVQFVRATERQLARGREGKLELARMARPKALVRFVRFLRNYLGSFVTL